MKLETFREVLAVLPKSEAEAMTVQQIAEKWEKTAGSKEAKLKQVYRSIQELCRNPDPGDDPDDPESDDIGSIVVKVHGVPPAPDRFYIDMEVVAQAFMSDAVALQVLLGRRAVNPAFAESSSTGLSGVERLAQRRLDAGRGDRRTRMLASRVRVVPDGFDRLPAQIDPDILREVVYGITHSKMLSLRYRSSKGEESTKKLGPLGLVMKDGSVYLVCCGTSGRPIRTLPLHRMISVSVTSGVFVPPARFDLDAWLQETGQMNHPQDTDNQAISLVLKVAPGSVWHFQERPLSPDQAITGPEQDGWFRVTATTRRWYTLTAFLASFGPYIKVVGPPQVLEGEDGMVAWARGMAAHYTRYKGKMQ
jgi:predicted DNA-binding transcriptional regulator YafY